MEKTIYLTITKSYASSATEHTEVFQFEGVTNLLGFLNESIEQHEDIFSGLTFNDPGDETWTMKIGNISPFKIKTWYDINLFIRGLIVSATYEWL